MYAMALPLSGLVKASENDNRARFLERRLSLTPIDVSLSGISPI